MPVYADTVRFSRISRYRVLEDGKAEFLGLTEADQVPWGLTLSPDGKFLLVSATTGASLAAYRISMTETSRERRWHGRKNV